MDDASKQRYSRQLSLDGFGEAEQERLLNARVLVAGAGGLGSAAAYYLAAAGIGSLRIIDGGEVELGNLNRQILYADRDIGEPKAVAAAKRIIDFNPTLKVEPLAMNLDEANASALLEGCDAIVDALDSLPARYALNKAALRKGIPLIHGAASQFFGQLMTMIPGETPCLMCLYKGKINSGATPVIGVAPGVIGLLQATEAIKLIAGIGKLMRGRLLVFDGLLMSFTEIEIPRDPECPHCGEAARGKRAG